MAEDIYTVDAAAERLQLHPKTVLRFIREGRLKATRMGKSYRILRSDVEAMAGIPPRTESGTAEDAWITAIVDVPGVSSALAQKWARTVPNALNARGSGPPLRAEVIYDPERSHLKIVIVGPPGDTVDLLNLVRVWIEQLEA